VEAAAHAIKMRQLAAAEEAEVRPDFVVCCASATSSDAMQALRREQKRAASRTAEQQQEHEQKRESSRQAEVCVRTLWSAVQACLCSDASQELRRKEQKREAEERKQEKVRPDCVVCCASATMF
jgi:hypothetical protein